jgi:hypothetical protein
VVSCLVEGRADAGSRSPPATRQGDRQVCHLLGGQRPVVVPPAQLCSSRTPVGGHAYPTPATRGPVQPAHPSDRQLRNPGSPADRLDPTAGLPEGPLDQVGVADPGPALASKAQVVVSSGGVSSTQATAGDRTRIPGAPAGGERLGAAARLGHRQRTAGSGDVVEALPAVGLDRVLVGRADLARVVRARWTRQRCRRLWGNPCPTAPSSPRAPSVMTNSSGLRPRATRFRRNPATRRSTRRWRHPGQAGPACRRW